MNATGAGLQGEHAAAEFLLANHFEIIDRNYKTPRCEIDIVARKAKRLYFVEVKYRSHSSQGGGLEYITAAKRGRMERAAEIWLQAHSWHGEVTMSAIEVGPHFEVSSFVESIV